MREKRAKEWKENMFDINHCLCPIYNMQSLCSPSWKVFQRSFMRNETKWLCANESQFMTLHFRRNKVHEECEKVWIKWNNARENHCLAIVSDIISSLIFNSYSDKQRSSCHYYHRNKFSLRMSRHKGSLSTFNLENKMKKDKRIECHLFYQVVKSRYYRRWFIEFIYNNIYFTSRMLSLL